MRVKAKDFHCSLSCCLCLAESMYVVNLPLLSRASGSTRPWTSFAHIEKTMFINFSLSFFVWQGVCDFFSEFTLWNETYVLVNAVKCCKGKVTSGFARGIETSQLQIIKEEDTREDSYVFRFNVDFFWLAGYFSNSASTSSEPTTTSSDIGLIFFSLLVTFSDRFLFFLLFPT